MRRKGRLDFFSTNFGFELEQVLNKILYPLLALC